jgi:hypothetical protein
MACGRRKWDTEKEAGRRHDRNVIIKLGEENKITVRVRKALNTPMMFYILRNFKGKWEFYSCLQRHGREHRKKRDAFCYIQARSLMLWPHP